ncbi:MAG: RNA polymerase sigma factor [Candidatus Limnocylindria bacterium]
MDRAKSGDRDAFGLLARMAGDRLYAVAQRILRDPELAGDVTQQTLVKVWRELPSLRESDRFDAWSYRLVVNACYDELRRQTQPRSHLELLETDSSTPDASLSVADRDQIAMVPLGLPSGGPCAATATIGAGPDTVWAGVAEPAGEPGGPGSGVVVGIDPSSNEVIMTVRPASLPCGGLAADLGSVWVSACPDARQASIVRIDRAAGGSSASIQLDGFAGDPVLREGLVWVPVVEASDPFGSGPGSVVAFDVQTGSATDAIRLGADVPVHGTTAAAAVIAFDALWITGDGGELLRIPLAGLDG